MERGQGQQSAGHLIVVLLPECPVHCSVRLISPCLKGHPSLQNQDSATARQKPESHIPNESDHRLGVHLHPTAQVNLLWSHCVSAMVTTALPQARWGGNRPKQLRGCSCWDEKGCLWHQAKWIQFPQLLNDKDFRDTTPSLWRIAGYRTGGEEVSLIVEEGWLLRLSSLILFFLS